MPDSSVFTGIDPTNLENAQLESQQRLAEQEQRLPTSVPSTPNMPDVTKGDFGTVAPDQNVNIDKTSPEFSQNFYNNLIGQTQKEYPGTFNQLPKIDLPESETKRFTTAPYGFDINRNNETFYADRQGIPSMLANSLWNGVVKTVGYAAQNTGFILGAPVAAVSGDITNMTDNFLTRLGDSMKDWVQTTNPIYKSDKYQNGNIFQKLGTLGWWTDDAMDRIALTAAMLAPGLAESKGIGLFGTAAVEGSDALKAVGPGAKAIESIASNPQNYGLIGKTFLKGLYNAAANGEADLATSPLLRSYAQGLKRAEFYSWNLIGQSGLNAKETQDAVYQATGNKEKAADAGMKSFMETIPLALASSLIELPQMFSSMNTAKSIMSKIYDRETGQTLADALELQSPSIGKLMLKSLGTGLEHGQNESAQVAVSRHNEEAAEAKDPSKVKSIFQDFLDNIHDPNGQNNIALGTIQGMLMTLGGRAVDKYKKTDEQELSHRVNLFNAIEQTKLAYRSYNDDLIEKDPETGKAIVNPDGTPKRDQNKVALAAMSALGMDKNLDLKRDAIEKGDPLSASFVDFQTLKSVAYHFLQDPDGLQHLKNTLTLESQWASKDPSRINDLDEYGNEITPQSQLRKNLDYVADLNRIKNAIDQRHAGFTNLDIDEKDKTEVQRRAQFIDNLKRTQYSTAADQLFLNKAIEKGKAEIVSLGKGDPDKIISDPSDPIDERHNELVIANKNLQDALEQTKAIYKESIDKKAQKEAFNQDKKRKEVDKAFTAEQDKKTETAKQKAEKEEEPIQSPLEAQTPETVVTTPEEQKRQKFNDIVAQRDSVLKDPNATQADKQAANDKFLQDTKSLSNHNVAPIENKPEAEQAENYKKLSDQIPAGKSIHIDDLNHLQGDINDARKKGDISEEHEKSLFDKLNSKAVHGTILDPIHEDEEEDSTVKGPSADTTGSSDVDNDTTSPPLEDPEKGQHDSEYNPSTWDIDDSLLEPFKDFFSAIAFGTPNKTVTQEERHRGGHLSGRLDEDEYKQFKQTFLRGMTPDRLANYSGKIIKDNSNLPHSEETKNDIANGAQYGSVLTITDNNGNILYFGPNYEESTEQTPGYKQLVYSFNKQYWRLNQNERAQIAELRTGIDAAQWIKFYEQEADKQDLARRLNDQGKDVEISLQGVVPGMLRSGKNLVDSTATITPEMNPRIFIPPGPAEKFDSSNPKKNLFVLYGNQSLINGGLYAEIEDPNTKSLAYVRLIPKQVGDIPEMFENIKELYNHKFRDENEAEIVKNYIASQLFLNRPNRPGITINVDPDANITLSIVEDNRHYTPEEALEFISQTRFNIPRNDIDNPDEYAGYKIENGRVTLDPKTDYTNFVLQNSQTRELPIATTDGKRYIQLNSYLTFTFKDSMENMRDSLGKQELTPPGEHSPEKTPSQTRIWRHGQAEDDFQGKTSGKNDTPLTPKGEELAAQIGQMMKDAKVKSLVFSTILRARQTARIAAKVAGIKDMKASKLLATWDIGEYAGGPSDAFDEDWFIKHPDETVGPDGKKLGESFNKYLKRMLKAYQMIKALPEDTNVIAHSRNIRIWDAYRLNNEQWNDEALQKYMNIPKEHSFTDIAQPKEEVKDNSSLTKRTFTRVPSKEPGTDAEKLARDADKDKLLSAKIEGDTRPAIGESEIQKVIRTFPAGTVERLDNILHSDATAQFFNGGIKLYRDAKEGDGYHEAWHKFSQMYLTDKEKRGLYDELRKRDLRFKSRDGRNLTTKKASDFDIEEFLADDFKQYALSDGKGSRVVDRPYRNTIFRQILDFIKKFFFGEINPSKLYDELYNERLNHYEPSMNNAWWGKMNSQALNKEGDEIVPNDRAPYYRDYVDYLMGKQLLGLKTSTDAMRKSPDLTQAIYENIYNDLTNKTGTGFYDKMLDKFDKGEDINQDLAQDLFNILSSWEDFVQYHKEASKLFLNIPHYIVQDVPDSPGDYSENTTTGAENFESADANDEASEDYTDEGEQSLRPSWEHYGNEQSSWEGASPETKALVRMLPKIELNNGTFNEVLDNNGIPKLNDYAKTWTNLSIALSNLDDYADMIEKLKDSEVQAKIPEATELLNHLPDPYKVHNDREIKQIIRFRTDFNRAYIGIYSGRIYSDNSFFFNEETLRNQDAVKRLWTANFLNKGAEDFNVKQGNMIIDPETSRNYINTARRLSFNTASPQSRENMLDLLGFKFSPETKKQRYYQNSLAQILKDVQDNINKRLAYGQKITNPVQDLKYDLKEEDGEKPIAEGLSSTLDGLSYLESKYTSEVPSLSYRTAEGNMIHGLSLNHTLSTMINSLNHGVDYNDIKSKPHLMNFDVDNNPYVRGSVFLNSLYDTKSGRKLNNSLILGNYNGLKFENKDGDVVGYSTTGLNTGQKIIFDINAGLMKGAFEIPRTEASKSAYFVKLEKYRTDNMDPSKGYLPIGISEFTSGFNSPSFNKILIDNYLNDELYRMKTADNVPIFKQDELLMKSAKNYNLFRDILVLIEKGKNQERLKNAIKEDLDKMQVPDVINKHRDLIERAIEEYWNRELLSLKKKLNQENIDPTRIAPRLDRYGTDQKYRAFLANDFINKVEHIKMFDGDTIYQTHYKDFFKRSKGITSSGKTPITDDAFGNYMKSNEKETLGRFIGSKVPNDYTEVNTKNLTDDKRDSAYYDIYKKDLKNTTSLSDDEIEKMLDKYKQMTVADGVGYCTLDFHRQFLKSVDNWSDDQERQYKVELAKFRLKNADINPEYTAQNKAEDRDFLERNNRPFSNFQIMKAQYNGPLRTSGTYASVMDKFALTPLIPSAIEGKHLEALNNHMLKNGFGYVKFKSGTKKFASPSVAIYNEDGSAKDVQLGKADRHFLQYFKEQINTNPNTKTKNIFGSQIRKLIESNIFSRGTATPEDQAIHDRYVKTLKNIQDIQNKVLFGELGLTVNEKEVQIAKDSKNFDDKDPLFETKKIITVGNVQKLIATLHEQADQRELNDELKNYIQYDKDTNKILYPLETSLNRGDIQKMIMGLIDRTMRRIHINGDMMVQTSSSGWTSNDFNYNDRDDDNKRKYGTNGLANYHVVYDADGKAIRTEAARVKLPLNGGWEKLLLKNHPDGTKIGSIDRLNELLKNDEWRAVNRESLTLIAYRIPTQGYNSMEFFEPEAFLPAELGSTIVVPAEIVAKAGSDFDFDKLPIFRPSFDENGELVRGDDTIEGNYNKAIKLYREILEDPRHFKDLITPNSIDLIGKTIDDIAVALGKRSQEEVDSPSPYSGTQIYRYITSLRKFESLLSASKLLGAAATNNSFIPLMQQTGTSTNTTYGLAKPTINRTVRILLLSPDERKKVISNNKIDLSSKYDIIGNLKQEYFSELVNVTVDAPSDDRFGYTNISFENFGVLAYLIHQGIPFDRAMWFLHQPVLMRYYSDLRGKDISDSKLAVQARLFSLFTGKNYFNTNEDGKQYINKDEFNKDINTVLNGADRDLYVSKESLIKTTRKVNEVDKFVENPKSDFKEWNKLIFAHFLAMKEQAQLFRNFQSPLRFDVTKMQSPISAYQAWKGVDQIQANKLFTPEDFNKIDDHSIISPLNNKLLTAIIGERLMPGAYAPRFMYKAAQLITEKTQWMPKAAQRRFIANYEAQFMEYMIKSLGKIEGENIQNYSKRLLEGKNNMVRRFNDLIGKYPELKDNYNFVSRIRPNIPNSTKIKKFNLEVQRVLDNGQDDQNRYSREFRSLINFNDQKYTPAQQLEIQKFFKDMANLGFVQSGFNRSNISFQDIIPHEFFADMFKNAVKNFRELITNDDKMMNQFVADFNNQFKANEKTPQSWRGRNYYQTQDMSKLIQAKQSKMEIVKSDINTEAGKPEIVQKQVEPDEPDYQDVEDEDIYTPEEVERSQSGDIQFEEEQTSGYRNRTIKNAAADATIAIAVDFNSAGEKLTKSSVTGQGKLYNPVNFSELSSYLGLSAAAKSIADKLIALGKPEVSLNIAGNGIYTMRNINSTQREVDEKTFDLLNAIVANLQGTGVRIKSIVTGGQTGFDEAGAKAGRQLGIPTRILAPKGWTFRDITGKDISNEAAFKARFNESPSDEEIGNDLKEIDQEKKDKIDDNRNDSFTSEDLPIAGGHSGYGYSTESKQWYGYFYDLSDNETEVLAKSKEELFDKLKEMYDALERFGIPKFPEEPMSDEDYKDLLDKC